MANYQTRFACKLLVGNDDARQRAIALHAEYRAKLEERNEDVNFEIKTDRVSDAYSLIFTSLEGSGDPDQVVDFLARLGPALGLTGRWGFVWANVCDRDRFDGFGGGAVIVKLETGEVAASLDCESWLADTLGALAGTGR